MSSMISDKLIDEIVVLVGDVTQLDSVFFKLDSEFFEFGFKSLAVATLRIRMEVPSRQQRGRSRRWVRRNYHTLQMQNWRR